MKKAKTITEHQFKNLIAITKDGNHGLRNVLALTLSYFCGLRAKELASIKLSDVITHDGKIRGQLELEKSYTKGEKHRTIYLSNKKVKSALSDFIHSLGETPNLNQPLFKSQKGYHFSPNAMARVLSNIYKNGGSEYEGCSSHSGRRTLITKLVNKGVSVNKVQQIAGHSNISTTMGYVDTNPRELNDIMRDL